MKEKNEEKVVISILDKENTASVSLALVTFRFKSVRICRRFVF